MCKVDHAQHEQRLQLLLQDKELSITTVRLDAAVELYNLRRFGRQQ
jgi:hypothetical protein